MVRHSITAVFIFSGLLTALSSGLAQTAAARQAQPALLNRSHALDRYSSARERMVREDIAASGVTNARVLESIRLTPRHEFVAHFP